MQVEEKKVETWSGVENCPLKEVGTVAMNKLVQALSWSPLSNVQDSTTACRLGIQEPATGPTLGAAARWRSRNEIEEHAQVEV